MDAMLAQWLSALDVLDYYVLLRASRQDGADALRAHYHAFCTNFHPDHHRARGPAERAAVLQIFQRGNEAHRVLCDPGLRARYDAGLQRGERRLAVQDDAREGSRASIAPRAVRLEDAVKSPSAKNFARKTEEHFARREFKQARLTLQMALSMDPTSEPLRAYAAKIDAELATR